MPRAKIVNTEEDGDLIRRTIEVEALTAPSASAVGIRVTRQKSLLTFARPVTESVELVDDSGFLNEYRVVTVIAK